jgi:3-phosphoshikimate 1-carboxyvinyltransferase
MSEAAFIQLPFYPPSLKGTIALPTSKSESNRMLIIAACSKENIKLEGLSSARDTQTMLKLLNTDDYELDVKDAGTTMRFLTAYSAITGRPCRLTGTPRMQERPIGILVNALRDIGCAIEYEKKEGYPPVRIGPFEGQKDAAIQMRGDVSSQFISALMMTAPLLPKGLEINLLGEIGSRPYIHLTAGLMRKFGVNLNWDNDTMKIPPGSYHGGSHQVEADWSGAGYWYSMAALAREVRLHLLGLRSDSNQADIRAVEIYKGLGVQTEFTDSGVYLSKGPLDPLQEIDFHDCPDLAQTVAVSYAAMGKPCRFYGLQSLRVKETDRIAALQQELAKIGAKLMELDQYTWELIPSKKVPSAVRIATYDDHRMAMAFAPLMFKMHVEIEHPGVVAKSYPEFWSHLESLT